MSANKSRLHLLVLLAGIGACGWLGCGTDLPTSGQEVWGRHQGEMELIPIGSTLSEIIADPQRPYLYATDFDNDLLYFISSSSRRIVKELAIGSRPSDLALAADGNQLYVALSGKTEIAVVDLERQELVTAIPLSFSPAYIAAGRDPYFYVTSVLQYWKSFTNYGQSYLVDTEQNVATSIPQAGLLEIDPARSRLYVAAHRQIYQYEITAGAVQLVQQVETKGLVVEMYLGAGGTRIYAASTGFFASPEDVVAHGLISSRANVEVEVVEVFDAERMVKIGELYTGAFPRAIAGSGDHIVVAASDAQQQSQRTNFAMVFDAVSLRPQATHPLLGTPTGCAELDAATGALYVAVDNPYDLRERSGERQDLQIIFLNKEGEPRGVANEFTPPELSFEGAGGEEQSPGPMPDGGAGGEGTGATGPVENADVEVDVWEVPAGIAHNMILIPAGIFAMGSDRGAEMEQPVHPVHLDAYYIDLYEVTLGQYGACVDAGACDESAEAGRCVWFMGTDAAEPINCMTWYDARDYCQWSGLRLPSEAEWEKAARGTDGRSYPWGEQVDRSRANYKGGYGRAIAVGSYPDGISPYGVYEMGGNVWEWVADWYDANYYSESGRNNPAGPSLGTHRVLRGGSWCFLSSAMRSAHRQPYDPEITDTDIGFRCARNAE